ncbi:PEGA domain-containing protein [Bacteroidota bacterium]
MKTDKKYILFAVAGLIALLIPSCDKDVSITETETPSANGRIIINSKPQGAQIFINGYNTGKTTPDSIIHLENGTYITMLRHYPFFDIMDTLLLNRNNKLEVYTDFYQDTRNYGRISVASTPSQALVFIGDSCTNKTTPVVLNNLWAGEYKITCSFPEHRAKSEYVFVMGGEYKSIGLNLQDTSLCVDYNSGNSEFESMTSSCIEIDQDNVKWIGLPFRGLVKMEGESFTCYTINNSPLPNNIINCIAIDNLNRKWVGTPEGLVIIDNEQWTVFNENNSDMPQDYITCITFDNNGGAWIGATDFSLNKFLLYFDGTTWTSIPVTKYICCLAVDQTDRVWVGFDPGFEIWNGISWFNPVPDTLGDHNLRINPIESIVVDYDGSVWVGAGGRGNVNGYLPGGLYIFRGDKFTKMVLPENFISHIHLAGDGTKFISCLGKYYHIYTGGREIALIKIDPSGSVTSYDLFSLDLASILFVSSATDTFKNLWVATKNKGIMKLKGINL